MKQISQPNLKASRDIVTKIDLIIRVQGHDVLFRVIEHECLFQITQLEFL